MNIKIRHGMLLLLSCCLFFISCDKEDSVTARQMELSDGVVMLVQQAATKEVTVTNGDNWTVTVPNDASAWCTAQREGDAFVITVKENTDVNFRETVLIVKNENEQKTLPVRQTGTAPFIQFMAYDYANSPVSFAGESQPVILPHNVTAVEVDVFSNVPYEVTMGKNSWAKVEAGTDTRPNGHTTVRFTVEPNPADSDRGIEATFKQADGDYIVLLPVRQRKNLGSAIELTVDMFTVTPLEGAIKLNWILPEGTKYEKIIFEYDDKSTAVEGDKLTKEVLFTSGNEVTIDRLLAKYGAITFHVKIVNQDGESLLYNEGGFSFNAGQCLPAKLVAEAVETKVDLSTKATDVNDVDGLKWLSFSGKDGAATSQYANLVDGDIATFCQSETRGANPYNYIIIQVPDGIECTAFTIKTVNAENQVSQAPGLYSISIGGSADPTAGDWEKVFEQAQKEWKYGNYMGYNIDTEEYNFGGLPSNADGNKYRYKTLRPMKSQTIGKVIKYIKYAVTDRNHSAGRNDYFKLSEFEFYTVEFIYHDPEKE